MERNFKFKDFFIGRIKEMTVLKGKTCFSKKLACIILSILMFISFTPLHVFASTTAASDSGDPNQYGTEAY